jgi:hypothetical protein
MPTCYAEVVAMKFDGLGYVLAPDDPCVCIDLDHCVSPEGVVEPWARKIVKQLDSYTELSPGGDGLHIWVIAHVSFSGRRSKRVEIYASGRYMTVTAKHWEGTPEAMHDRTAEIEKLIADFPDVKPPPVKGEVSFEIDPEAQPPGVKHGALLMNDTRYRGSWEHTRTDLGDQSLSSYDMSLATIAAYAEWTDQEIVNLLISHRREHGNPEKALRSDYLSRTLDRARQATVVKLRDYEAAEVHRTSETREIPTQEGIAEISYLLALDVERVVQRGRDPASYSLQTKGHGELHIGSAEVLTSGPKARNGIMEKTGVYLPSMKKKEWERIVALVIQLSEYEEMGEGQRGTQAVSWVESYLHTQVRSQPEDRKGLAAALETSDWSFVWENVTYLRLAHFSQYLFKALGERVSTQHLAVRIAEVGWKAHRFRYRDEADQRKEANTWIEAGG